MKLLLTIVFALISIPALACDEAKQAINDLEQAVAANNIASSSGHPAQPITPNAVTGVEAAPFAQVLNTENDLQVFAQTSTFGGGRVLETDFHGERLLIVFRGYTSGVKSSDIGVYAEREGGWTLVKSHPPVMNTWIEAHNHGKDIIFKPEGNPRTVMVLTEADLSQ